MKYGQSRIILFLLLTISFSVRGQNQNKNWHFGSGISINFNILPLSVVQSNIDVVESAAAVSDDNGQLLFYTSGHKIWNRNGTEMPNATGLLGNGPFSGYIVGSGHRSIQIIRHPGNPGQYYVVSGDAYEQATRNLLYSLVDMSLDNGLGDVVPTQKNVQVMNNCSEFLNVFRGNDCSSYWLIARAEEPVSARPVYAFKVDQNGFNPVPVISNPPPNLGTPSFEELYQLNDLETAVGVNKDRVIAINFDGNTGTFSNFQPVYSFMSNNGLAHRPFTLSLNRTKLYVVESNVNVFQYDLDQIDNPAAFSNSRTLAITGTSTNFLDMRAGPDGHLYLLARGSNSNIARMTNADGPVSNTSYDNNFLEYMHPWMSPTAMGYYGLGIDVVYHPQPDTIYHPAKDTLLCLGESLVLQGSVTNASGYKWNDGSSQPTLTVSAPGTYWVSSIYQCQVTIDTFIVRNPAFTLQLPADTTICAGSAVLLDAYHPDFEAYSWSTGATTPSITVSEAGKYSITVKNGKCTLADTFELKTQEAILEISHGDTTICNISPIELIATCNIPSTYAWSNGTPGPKITPSATGSYTVTASNVCGTLSKRVHITVKDCDCALLVPTAFSPNGDGLNDVFVPKIIPGCNLSNYKLKVYNRYGQLIFSTNQAGLGWDGTSQNRPAEQGVYYYKVEYINYYSQDSQIMSGSFSLLR